MKSITLNAIFEALVYKSSIDPKVKEIVIQCNGRIEIKIYNSSDLKFYFFNYDKKVIINDIFFEDGIIVIDTSPATDEEICDGTLYSINQILPKNVCRKSSIDGYIFNSLNIGAFQGKNVSNLNIKVYNDSIVEITFYIRGRDFVIDKILNAMYSHDPSELINYININLKYLEHTLNKHYYTSSLDLIDCMRLSIETVRSIIRS